MSWVIAQLSNLNGANLLNERYEVKNSEAFITHSTYRIVPNKRPGRLQN